MIGKEGPTSKVLSGTYENVAEVGTGRVIVGIIRTHDRLPDVERRVYIPPIY